MPPIGLCTIYLVWPLRAERVGGPMPEPPARVVGEGRVMAAADNATSDGAPTSRPSAPGGRRPPRVVVLVVVVVVVLAVLAVAAYRVLGLGSAAPPDPKVLMQQAADKLQASRSFRFGYSVDYGASPPAGSA